MTPEQKQACKQKICAIPFMQFLNGGLAPVSALTGGLVPGCCPGPNQANPADLLKPADSAEGAAARIKKLEAEAKARRAAVRYLGTVDCRRFPEAEAALISSLRGDENECVRFEAALALGSGCCCTRKVLEALVVTVSGRKTAEPAETSPRVRAAAAIALERCLMKYCDLEVLTPADRPLEKGQPPADPASAPAKKNEKAALDPLVADGQQVLAAFKRRYAPAPRPTAEPPLPPASLVIHRIPATVTLGASTTPQPLATAMAQAPAPAPTMMSAPTPEGAPLPPTGQRDLWSVLLQTRR